MGADAILLIVRLLTDLELSNLYHLARKLGLDVLVEVYDDADAVRARNLGARLIAINNRDLTSFDTDVTRSHRLSSLLTPGTIIVAASGIAEASDIRRTLGSGINRFLIGESLVHAEYPIRLLQALNAIHPIEIKICGITDPETAAMCAAAGASAIGMVFYPPSPRNVSLEQARAIAAQIPFGVAKTGVFADQDADTILRIAFESGLDVAQLHRSSNRIPPELFTARGLPVVMALNLSGDALLEYVRRTPFDTGILVECGQGPLPGGNGQEWRWADAAVLRGLRPFAVAGGLTPENVVTAITESGATAVDVSSSVEQSPGVKDFGRVREFIAAARSVSIPQSSPVFWRPYPTISNLST